ncbi:hypothetical protein EMPG_09667 [Blastomyces silverae]|uniref:Uncharacterized protein n=1 Tax=Blastomyces silverae TaxID=2060906 RepID=A0A0H1BJN4_9EURO|nr:hypothetical protein EMPG_09667 [Blastomyces silverae]
MPTLKQLSCQIEWAGSNVPFKEYGTTYGDGFVECYIAIPNSSTPFSINLRSSGYIAPGLAMFVFMDGVYQCNRNRDDLRPMPRSPETIKKFRDISFRVRQREERFPDGRWIGRPWRFERFQLVKFSGNNDDIAKHFERLGTIQIVVLRCAAHPRANLARDDDVSDGAQTPESGMAPGSGCEDDDSVSSEESFVYEHHSGRSQEGNGEIWGALGGLFDGPYDSTCHVPGAPHQYSYPHCCPACHRPRDNNQGRPSGYPLDHTGGSCQHTRFAEADCHMDHTRQETVIDAPDIPPCRRQHSRGHNLHSHSGCCMPRPNLPLNTHESDSHPSPPLNRHLRNPRSSSRENTAATISHAEAQGDSRLFVPPIILNISPHILGDGNSSLNKTDEKCTKSDDNGYYVISDGKRVPESSGYGQYQHNPTDSRSGADINGKKKSKRRRRSRGKDKKEEYQADSNQQDESSRWDGNGDNQDRCGVDGEATPCPGTESNQADNTDNNTPLPGDWNISDENHHSPTRIKNDDSNPNVQPLPTVPNQYQEPFTTQIQDFSERCVSQQPVFVSPMLSEPARDEPPLYTVPESVARAESLTHQVQLGPQARYVHRIRTPKYLDTMDKPYAEFVFKYRAADVIQDKFHVTVVADIDEERRKLEALPRVEIVNQLLRAQGLLSTSNTNNNRSPRTSPPAPFAQPQSPNERIAPSDSFPNMSSSSQNAGGGNWPGFTTSSPPCSKGQHSGSGGGNVTTQSDDWPPASLNHRPGQASQGNNGGNGGWNGEASCTNRNSHNGFHGTHDNNNDSRSSWDRPTAYDAHDGDKGTAGNGPSEWGSGAATNSEGIAW